MSIWGLILSDPRIGWFLATSFFLSFSSFIFETRVLFLKKINLLRFLFTMFDFERWRGLYNFFFSPCWWLVIKLTLLNEFSLSLQKARREPNEASVKRLVLLWAIPKHWCITALNLYKKSFSCSKEHTQDLDSSSTRAWHCSRCRSSRMGYLQSK